MYLLLPIVLLVTLGLTWLRWESGLPRDEWFAERQGHITDVHVEESIESHSTVSQSVRLKSSSGLQVGFRVIRKVTTDAPVPLLLILGGHRTGSDAVDLFGDPGQRVIVGVDYPYDGPDKVTGLGPTLKTVPMARRAILDTVPAISLILDWLLEQAWVDKEQIIIVGGSLGVPFATAAAARDLRISALIIVHGAADIRLWLERQIERRIDNAALHYPLSAVLYWLAYGPVFDTARFITMISPRPVLIVGARDDERTPAGQAELLFEAAREPKRLRFTDGRHIQPNRTDVIAELLRIADEEMMFLTQ